MRLIGCPAEERGNGKVHLMNGGAFEGVDAALMYHPGDRDEIDPLMLAMVNLDVELLGKAAHAAAEPHDGVNALDGLVLGWNAMSALRLLVRSDSRIHGIITDGGKAANIIPDRAAARLMVRSPDNTYLADLRRRVLACFEGAALATGAELRPMWSEVCEVVNTNRPLAEAFAENARALGRTMLARRPSDTHGSTDMGNVTTKVPGIQISELFPQVSRRMDKLSIVRSMHTKGNDHPQGTHYAITGHDPNPAMRFPSIGSIIASNSASVIRLLVRKMSVSYGRV